MRKRHRNQHSVKMRCPYCSSGQGRSATTSSGRYITECTSCGRVVEERQTQSHHLFHTRAQDTPLCLVTSDLPSVPVPPAAAATPPNSTSDDEDPFEHTGFITAFSTWSLEPYPVFAQSSFSFSGHLAELERVMETTSSSSSSNPSAHSVVVDNLRAYLQIIDVASILGLESYISDHAFQLFRDCSSATCLRNRSVEALATAALVQAIREAQEPRTLQEISLAANLPQKEIGKYIKILGEALQLSQPINSNSISVHMPRFCTLLQLNKSAQELATHIGEVVINKCFCTRRNPISISAAAIYLACQLEDKRKTQAEICKVTGLTEVTLRKVYKELLENWDDLLPSNYNPVVPPEKAFPMATIASGRSSTNKLDLVETLALNKYKQTENRHSKPSDILDTCRQAIAKDDTDNKETMRGNHSHPMLQTSHSLNTRVPIGSASARMVIENNQNKAQDMEIDQKCLRKVEERIHPDGKTAPSTLLNAQLSTTASTSSAISWSLGTPLAPGLSSSAPLAKAPNENYS